MNADPTTRHLPANSRPSPRRLSLPVAIATALGALLASPGAAAASASLPSSALAVHPTATKPPQPVGSPVIISTAGESGTRSRALGLNASAGDPAPVTRPVPQNQDGSPACQVERGVIPGIPKGHLRDLCVQQTTDNRVWTIMVVHHVDTSGQSDDGCNDDLVRGDCTEYADLNMKMGPDSALTTVGDSGYDFVPLKIGETFWVGQQFTGSLSGHRFCADGVILVSFTKGERPVKSERSFCRTL